MRESDRFVGLVTRFDNWLTEKENSVINILGKPFGVRRVITHNSEERIRFLTDFLKAHKNATSIKIATGGGSELDEIVLALEASGVLEDRKPTFPVAKIRVAQTPIGPAPEEIRRAWVGVEMKAIKFSDLPSGTLGPEVDWVTGQPFPQRESYVTLSSHAIQALKEHNPQAAGWFEKNYYPGEHDNYALSFGVDEVEVLASR